jgi:hypothetical protein
MKEFYYIWCEGTAKNRSRFILDVILSGTLMVMNNQQYSVHNATINQPYIYTLNFLCFE